MEVTHTDMCPPVRPGETDTFRFRRFHLDAKRRQLVHDGRPVPIGGRAFDLLLVLARSRGTILRKDFIVDYVWPSTFVDESNLRYQVASLRRVLGDDRDIIKTIPGRGYLFVDEDEGARKESRERLPRQHIVGVGRHEVGAVGLPRNPVVAIVDDDCETREALQGFLRSAGLQAESFGSTREFADAPRESPPDCLILDVWLPGRNGLQFQAELAKEVGRSPVIFISGHADVQMCVQAMKAGAVEFLTKPVRHQALLEAVELAIASGKGRADTPSHESGPLA